MIPRPRRNKKKNWKNFLKEIELDFPFLAALMQKGRVDDTGERRITVELADCSSFDVKRLEDKGNDLKKACENLLGKKLKIVVVSEKNRLKQEQRKKKKQTARQAVYQHPLVVKAKEIFNGEIINI